MAKEHKISPNLSALMEIGVMFLPAIPAYLWVWPNVQGTLQDIFQVFVYVYILAGTLFIGLRRWNWGQLGINRQGIWLSLVCGLVILTARLMIILSINWNSHPAPANWLSLVGNVLFYIGLVGLVEELLFRGLIYRLLEDWGGVRWAIWGSSFGFLLWHIFGQGPLVGLVTMLIGLLFALIRWRAGGILGLILLHGLWDLESILLVADSNAEILSPGNYSLSNQTVTGLGTVLLILVPVYLWKLHPLIERIFKKT